MSPVQVTDRRRRLVKPTRQRQRVRRDNVEAREPHTGLVLAALREHIRKDVKLVERGVEP
jgi:hypothetical protein